MNLLLQGTKYAANAPNLVECCFAYGSKAAWKLVLKIQTSPTAFSRSIKSLRRRGGKRCCFHLSIFSGSQRNREILGKIELEPWMTSCPLKDTSPLGPHLCIGHTVVALCPVHAKEKCQNISPLLSNTGCDLNAESHVKSENLTPDLIVSFTKVCGNQDLAVCDFKNIYLCLACDPCWYKLKLLSVLVPLADAHQIHTKSRNVPHIKLRLLRQMNVWLHLIFVTYLFNFVKRISVCDVQQDELTLLTCTIMQYLLSRSFQPFQKVSFLHYVTASYLGWHMKGGGCGRLVGCGECQCAVKILQSPEWLLALKAEEDLLPWPQSTADTRKDCSQH